MENFTNIKVMQWQQLQWVNSLLIHPSLQIWHFESDMFMWRE